MRPRLPCLIIMALPGLAPDVTRAWDPSEAPELRTLFDRAVTEFDEAQQIQADRPDQARRLFRSAAQGFHSIVAAGVVNGHLEFNLGNSYLQSGDVGRAILHYRRAERLIPRDPLLADNLGVARARCLTSIKPTRRSAFLRNVFFWHYQTSLPGRATAALVLYVLFWTLLTVWNVVRVRAITVCAIVVALTALACGGSVAMAHWTDRSTPEGVVLDMDVPVHKGPGTGYQRQFDQPLQPGVEFTLRDRAASGWWRIWLPDGHSGWIEARHADLVFTVGG